MRKLITICATLGALSGMGMATTWSGTLLDAHCHRTAEACYAKRSTTRFLLDVNGTKYRLDARTNRDVRSAFYENKGLTKTPPVTATITGQMRSSGSIH